MRTNICFKCGEPVHFAKDCPRLQQPVKGRAFVMTADQADPGVTVITCMICLADIPTITLIDFGAIHSFISESFI